ncbi:hypothetical protein VAE151_630593 [Vibrio aestuarianus]|uniref:Uncharacterized protein n=1 Tax=Vibrio aestuarianus TaxID=28171 RepID=A0ABM9FIX5_9VIBR|nr:hypothetical protein VAE063_1010068 [Vibrio aestuarianus]CAH8225354.1 hypothetical protein VIBAE_B10677 [Vibrio aestuarianus subsp. francensis]CAH8222316.1 hypothetical protein VAE308_1250015 [Vibrio aestuarianus]CAH8227060.1 hypothetical protein VAE128_500585 [Vibrio aestuarianus]CAH8227065.1 hypothetical protein VAE032_330067 [Vibrio aestuarianus]
MMFVKGFYLLTNNSWLGLLKNKSKLEQTIRISVLLTLIVFNAYLILVINYSTN